MIESWIGRETEEERYIGERCTVVYGNLRRNGLTKCVEWTPGPPSGNIPRENETGLIDRGANGDLKRPIHVYGENQAECMIGAAEEGHEKCRCQELMELHRDEIDVRGINSRIRCMEMEVNIIDAKWRIDNRVATNVDLMMEIGCPEEDEPTRVDEVKMAAPPGPLGEMYSDLAP